MSQQQSQEQKIAGGVGVVKIGDLEVTVTPLSQSAESLFDRRLRLAAQESHGDYYTHCRGLLEAMKDYPGDRLEAIREITRLTAQGSPISSLAILDYRFSPAGVAMELFARGKKATPGLDPKALAAIITDVNCDDVAAQLHEIIVGGDPKSTR